MTGTALMNPPPTIRVSIVEEDRGTREGFVKLLGHAPELVCLGAYADLEEAEREFSANLPDVVLMDINFCGRRGIEGVARLQRAHPHLRFLMLTTYDNHELIFDALLAGANGYLLKRSAPTELLAAIEQVHRGGSPMSIQIARKVVSHFNHTGGPAREADLLTKREHEILLLLTKGLSYKQIATRLAISPGTVHGHLHSIYSKLQVQSRAEATARYLDR